MAEYGVENEVKLYCEGGAFAYDGVNHERAMERVQKVLRDVGIEFDDYRVRRFTDTYYSDPAGVIDSQNSVLRLRDEGERVTATVKKPYVHSGLGLSRREFQSELVKSDEGFNPLAMAAALARQYLDGVGSDLCPKVVDEVVRCECRIRSEVRRYKFCLDRFSYHDPVSGEVGPVNYEIEIESIDQPIKDDQAMVRLIAVLEDRYLCEAQKVSKYARGKEWLESIGV